MLDRIIGLTFVLMFALSLLCSFKRVRVKKVFWEKSIFNTGWSARQYRGSATGTGRHGKLVQWKEVYNVIDIAIASRY